MLMLPAKENFHYIQTIQAVLYRTTTVTTILRGDYLPLKVVELLPFPTLLALGAQALQMEIYLVAKSQFLRNCNTMKIIE